MRKDVKEKKRVICPNCEGTGVLVTYRKDGKKGIEHHPCLLCNSNGIVLRRVTIEYAQIDDFY